MVKEIRFTFNSVEDAQKFEENALKKGLRPSQFCKMIVYKNLNGSNVE